MTGEIIRALEIGQGFTWKVTRFDNGFMLGILGPDLCPNCSPDRKRIRQAMGQVAVSRHTETDCPSNPQASQRVRIGRFFNAFLEISNFPLVHNFRCRLCQEDPFAAPAVRAGLDRPTFYKAVVSDWRRVAQCADCAVNPLTPFAEELGVPLLALGHRLKKKGIVQLTPPVFDTIQT